MMNSALFQEEAKSKATKSINQANINATIMRNIKIPVPSSLTTQQSIVAEIQAIESQLKEAQKVIDSVGEKKQAIMKAYL